MIASASAYARLERCAAGAVLSQVHEDTEYSAQGTDDHWFLRRCSEAGIPAAIAELPPELRERAEAMPLDRVDLGLSPEVSLAWDPETGVGRELGRGVGRDAAYKLARPGELTATLDLVGWLDGVLSVQDHKTGTQRVEAARTNLQLVGGAVIAAATYGADDVLVKINYVRPWEPFSQDVAELGPWELAEGAERLQGIDKGVKAARARIAAGRMPDVSAGAWCQYCPARRACPAHVEHTLTLARASTGPLADWVGELSQRGDNESKVAFRASVEALSPRRAGDAWLWLKDAERFVKRGLAELERFSEHTPLELPDGSTLVHAEVDGAEVIDVETARAVLTEVCGPAAADGATKTAITKDSIKAAIRTYAEPRGLARLERRILGLIRERGGITRRREKQMTETKGDDE